jgi:hypothetical protein
MQPLDRRSRFAVGIWLVLAAVVGNGVYDVLMALGVKEYLFRHAMNDAGKGALVPLADFMEANVRSAAWAGTLCASVILLAGMVTIRVIRPSGQANPER